LLLFLATKYKRKGESKMNKLTVVQKLVILKCKYAYAMARLWSETFTRKEAIDYQTIALNQFLGVK
jgi:hypothetical protein